MSDERTTPEQVERMIKYGPPDDSVAVDIARDLKDCRARLDAVTAERNDLLAIIHRDGGHHSAKVGDKQSVADAHTVWAAVVSERDAANERVETLRAALESAPDPWPEGPETAEWDDSYTDWWHKRCAALAATAQAVQGRTENVANTADGKAGFQNMPSSSPLGTPKVLPSTAAEPREQAHTILQSLGVPVDSHYYGGVRDHLIEAFTELDRQRDVIAAARAWNDGHCTCGTDNGGHEEACRALVTEVALVAAIALLDASAKPEGV